MFHSVTSETKQQNDAARTRYSAEAQPEFRPPFNQPAVRHISAAGVNGWPPTFPVFEKSRTFARFQNTHGNQAVLRMLGRFGPAPRQATSWTGGSVLQRKCACGGSEGECTACKEEREGTLQRAAALPDSVNTAPPIVYEVLRSPGQPLDSGVRAFMEEHFGYDFSAVRIHTDAKSADSARSVNALTYTVGRDVVFDRGQYAPSTPEGRRTLAHELTHVVQQSTGIGGGSLDRLTVSDPGDAYEKEAEVQARAVTADSGFAGFHTATSLHLFGTSDKAAVMLQRQTVGGPLDLKPDPCITLPIVGKVCGQAAADACKKLPANPICDGFCKVFDCRKPKHPTTKCPDKFKPAEGKEFQGQCCIPGKEGTVIENAQNCCPPERIPVKATTPRCCAEGEIPDAEQKSCMLPPVTRLTLCPPDQEAVLSECVCFPLSRQNSLKGTCCPEGQEGGSGVCKKPAPPPPPGPGPSGQPAQSPPGPIVIHFNLDRPRRGEQGGAALSSSLTRDGQSSLTTLIALLKQHTDWKVELVGKASPEGTDAYNMDLSARRARMIARALQDALGQSPVTAGPDPDLPAGCQTLDSGLFSCGEIGASGAGDRQVRALTFIPGKPAAP